MLEIRKATTADVNSIASLFDQYRQFYEQAPDIALATKFIAERIKRQESTILVAKTNNEIIGFCQMYPTFCSVEASPIMVLYDLYVDPSARKAGAGRALMQAAFEYAKDNGFTRLYLSTAKTNSAAQTLYESLGWVRDEQFYYYSLNSSVNS